MSLDNFNSQEWSARLQENLNDIHVYAALLNHNYEGEIKEHGDSVRINSIGRITISTYTKNSTTLTRQKPVGVGQVLVIDQSDSFDFVIDDVDKAQQQPQVMSDYMREAAWGFSDTADARIATLLEGGVASDNQLSAAASVGTGSGDDDAYQLLVDLDVKLDDNNVPGDRWVVVPNWFKGMLRKDPRFVSFGTSENRAALTRGAIGEVAGLTVHTSNNVPVSGSAYTVIAGYNGAATFAEQIDSVEAYRPEGSFGDAMKGLHLYGYKVTRPTALASVVATSA